jgi:hypothetical protein
MRNLTATQRLTPVALAVSVCLLFSSPPANAAEPFTPLDRKSFNTIPPDPAPSEAKRRELDRAVSLCVKTVESLVPGNPFEASVDGGIVNTAGIDRMRFSFWKCMSDNGHPLVPINKSDKEQPRRP